MFWGGDLIRLPVWSFSPSTHDARCYSSHCVCSHNICHKCSLCNRNSQSGLPSSCAPRPPPQPWLFFFLWHLMILMCFIKKCMSGAQDSSLIFASFSQHFLFRKSLRGSLFICVHWNAACPYLHWSVCFFFFTSIHTTDFFLPLVFPSHTDSSYICRPPD